MLKTTRTLILPLLIFLSNASGDSVPRTQGKTPTGLNPGPDIITGMITDLQQYGSSGTQVGLGVSTTSCNTGTVPVDFFRLPSTDHPVIPHNLYRMSGGSNNDQRFEQIGHSWVKHAFGADQLDDCSLGCIPADFTHLGVGCSDTYLSFQNAIQNDLGSRALVNPFTGVFQSTANSHSGHTHTGTSHRILVEASDLNQSLNAGATYYCEVQYITPMEYAWCQVHPGECNMYNNSSYRRFEVSGTTSFVFTESGPTQQMMPAIRAWPGATINPIEPEPGVDGRAFIAFRVTGPVAGIWHYEYALYNENLDRGIQSFSVPLGCGITVSNLGFHAPPNHPGFPNDGSQNGAGFSNSPWTPNQTGDAITWATETLAQNQNANAIRWGTLYNFRFDSDHAPTATNATIGFFKTGAPTSVAILAPNACNVFPTPTPTPTGSTPTATPSTPTPTPQPSAQALNLSTRVVIQAGDGAGIGGFILSGTTPKRVLLRAIGPSLSSAGVPNPLPDPILELHGPLGFTTIICDNGDCSPGQPRPSISLPPGDALEPTIAITLDPGAYTAIVRGNGDPTGVALVEIYDLQSSVDSKLANLSTRAFVNTGSEIVITGFILGNNDVGPAKIALRGVGPSLASAGVPGLLANPTLQLRDGNGSVVTSNDNWQDNPAQAAELVSLGLAPSDILESGIVATLSPGSYTALLAGANNETGVGLVEVYSIGAP